MIRVKSCCCCIDLETGGKIWGWLVVVFGILIGVRSIFDTITIMEIGEVLVTVCEIITKTNDSLQMSSWEFS
jgi:hypothetical protein